MRQIYVYEITNGQLHDGFESVLVTSEYEPPNFAELLLVAMKRTQDNGEMFQAWHEPHMVLARHLQEHHRFSLVEAPPQNKFDFKELQEHFQTFFGREYDPLDFERIQTYATAKGLMQKAIEEENL